MRQASWIAFLLLAVGLLSYEASLDQQEATATEATVTAPEVDIPAEGDLPPPRP